MPSQLHRQTGPYGAAPDTTSHQVGGAVKGLAVLLCVGSHGAVADTLLTTNLDSREAGCARLLCCLGPGPCVKTQVARGADAFGTENIN